MASFAMAGKYGPLMVSRQDCVTVVPCSTIQDYQADDFRGVFGANSWDSQVSRSQRR